ncbi:MAG: hypothetical protein CVU39_04500 [Chloroflexi bacterium HGW-Chloroflexi-10]|nr:MAG: hypothetical protein CVU39_04500 [Chloroflexi bacterium HGW-Chloroflexi-10]
MGRMKKIQVNPRILESAPMQRCRLNQCRAACCLYGVWIDRLEWENILNHREIVQQYMPALAGGAETWFEESWEDDPFTESGQVIHSLVVKAKRHYGGTACVFLRRDHKCALQVASVALGEHPWFLKPFYCILHPLDLDEEGHITLDETEVLLSEEGSCLRSTEDMIPLWETFEEELRYFLGDEAYDLGKKSNG